jgi:ribose/xylose/arabinose/galactoside ABC-type transport system permease subunit
MERRLSTWFVVRDQWRGIADQGQEPVERVHTPVVQQPQPHDHLHDRDSISIMLVAVIAPGLFLARSTTGRYIYAAGGNRKAARLAGVRVNLVGVISFTLGGGAAGAIPGLRALRAAGTSAATDCVPAARSALSSWPRRLRPWSA